MGTIFIDWSKNTMQWQGESVDDTAGCDQYVSFGQYHVWGATGTHQDIPDGTDLTNGSKDTLLESEDHTDFGGGSYDAKQITVLQQRRAFWAFEASLGSLVEYKTSSSGTDWSTQPWIRFDDPNTDGGVTTFGWNNGTGLSKDFKVYYTGRAGSDFQSYYRVQ